MAEISFYTNPMSRGQIARWALEESGANYTQVLLDYGTTMKGADYLAINPMGKVPAIVHHTPQGDQIVTETAAICAYLAEAFPQAGLAPTAEERARYFRWMFFAAGPVEAAVTTRAMGWHTEDPQNQAMLGFGNYDKTVEVLAQAVSQSSFIAGERFTAADIYVGSQVDWGVMFKSLPALPALEKYAARLRERPAYRRAKEIDGKLIAEAQAKAAN